MLLMGEALARCKEDIWFHAQRRMLCRARCVRVSAHMMLGAMQIAQKRHFSRNPYFNGRNVSCVY